MKLRQLLSLLFISLFFLACGETKSTISTPITPPILAKKTYTTLNENSLGGTALGSINIISSGDSNITKITLMGKGSEYFRTTLDGNVSLKLGAIIDYETATSYTLSVVATNTAGNSNTMEYRIIIKNIFDLVPILSNTNFFIEENAVTGASIGTITINKTGDSAISSIALTGTGNENFNVDNSGKITLSTTAIINGQKGTIFNLTAIATNKAGKSNAIDVKITITKKIQYATAICDVKNDIYFNPLRSNDLSLIAWRGKDTNNYIQYNEILGANSYKYDMTIYAANNWEIKNVLGYGKTKLIFFYDAAVDGINYTFSENALTLSSKYFNTNDEISITVKAYDTNKNLLQTSNSLKLTIGKSYLTDAPKKYWMTSNSQKLGLQWCSLNGISQFNLAYGTNKNSLNQTQDINGNSTLITGLTNDTPYYFSLAGVTSNGLGKSTQVIKATPSSNISTNFAISKVTFNQAVQVDVSNNTNATPIIAGKPGILRIYTNVESSLENQKVEILLGGIKSNGEKLTPIVKEVVLSNSTFNIFDSTNKPIIFQLTDANWLEEGTRFYVDIDPNNRISETSELDNRYPSSSELLFGFEKTYKMRINLIPIKTNTTTAIISNTNKTNLTNYLKAMYPLSEIEITIDNTLTLNRTLKEDIKVWIDIIDDIVQYKQKDIDLDPSKKDIFYYGVLIKDDVNISGIGGIGQENDISYFDYSGWEPSLVAVGRLDVNFLETVAHEIGHNHGRKHIDSRDETNDNCAIPFDFDAKFPYNNSGSYGRISKTGYNYYNQSLYEKSIYHDIMTYCQKQWVSDYTYKAIHEFEKKLDSLYNRNISPRAINNSLRVLGRVISGRLENGIWKLTREYQAKGKVTIVNFNSRFTIHIELINGKIFDIPILLHSFDYSDIKSFKIFVPSREDIRLILLHDDNTGNFISLDLSTTQ